MDNQLEEEAERQHIEHGVEVQLSNNVYSPAIYTPTPTLRARLPLGSERLPRLNLGLGTTTNTVSQRPIPPHHGWNPGKCW